MKNIFITSLNPGVGKTTFTLALALKLKDEGYNVGYFKPITDNINDTDAIDAKELLGMPENKEIINPVIVTAFEYDMPENHLESIKTKISDAYNQLIAKYDFLVIESCRKAAYLAYLKLSGKDLAEMFNAKVIIVTQGREIEDVDRIILGYDYFKASNIEVLGAIQTLVPDELLEHIRTIINPGLKKNHGICVLGLIPDRGTLAAPTVEEVASALGARVLAGSEYLNNLVENYVVGAMQPETALKYLRRSIRKAVITGGDRPQLAIAALETDTSAIILTGSILPPAQVLSKAEEKKVPILLVSGDTYSTIKTLTETPIYGKLHADQKEKLEAWNMILENVDYKKIIDKLKA